MQEEGKRAASVEPTEMERWERDRERERERERERKIGIERDGQERAAGSGGGKEIVHVCSCVYALRVFSRVSVCDRECVSIRERTRTGAGSRSIE